MFHVQHMRTADLLDWRITRMQAGVALLSLDSRD
jgi:hypothetical protein